MVVGWPKLGHVYAVGYSIKYRYSRFICLSCFVIMVKHYRLLLIHYKQNGITVLVLFSEHVFLKISYCVFKILIRKWKKNYKPLILRGLSTENFLAIWLSQ